MAYYLVACPKCDALQIHEGLDTELYMSCRRCDKRSASPDFRVLHSYQSVEHARRDYRLYTTPMEDGTLPERPPVLGAVSAVRLGGGAKRARLYGLLRSLAERNVTLSEEELVGRLEELNCAHMLKSLEGQGLVYKLKGEGPTLYRVSKAVLA